jgi:myo-inositol-1(or 4)-monophosphatase
VNNNRKEKIILLSFSKMKPEELDELYEFVLDLVKKCGDIFIEGLEDCGEVKTKGADHDLVTYYDGKIEEILINGIKEKYPDHV